MANTVTKIALVLSISAVAACGGSGGGTTGGGTIGGGGGIEQGPQSFTRGPTIASFDTNTQVLSYQGREIGRSNDEVIESNGRARITRNRAFNSRVAQAETPDAYALAFGTYNGSPLSGAVYGRDEIPDMPSGGTATFFGDYGGVTTRNTGAESQAISSLTTGDARLAVDFNDMNVSGSITNRQVFRANGGPFPGTSAANITLQSTNLTNDGRFAGSTAGGQFIQSGNSYTASAGGYSGVLAGDDADQGVGALEFQHTSNGTGNRFVERGSFAVTR